MSAAIEQRLQAPRVEEERVFDLLLEEIDQRARTYRWPSITNAVHRLRNHFAPLVAQEAAWWTIAEGLAEILRVNARGRTTAPDVARMLLLVHEQIEYTRELAEGHR